MITYEQRLSKNFDWALREGSMHFEKDSAVHRTLRKIAKRLQEFGIPYAVAGAMDMFFHGYRRFTEAVDLLVTPQGLGDVHRCLEGLGYLPPFTGSKDLRDSEFGVKVEFLTTGDYPGDGKPKPVAFPDPEQSSVEIDGMRFLSLPKLVELKLASGMTNPARRRDLADVQDMIRTLGLSVDLSDQLNPFVRDMFKQLWLEVHTAPPNP